MEDARAVAAQIGFPLIIRPSYTLGGTGASVAYNVEEFEALAMRGLESSLITEILIEESVIGWKEFELEVMRDRNDNVVIICSIENVDPWASIPETASPSHPHRPSPTKNIRSCATPRSDHP